MEDLEYFEELKEMRNALKNIEDKIKTRNGKREYYVLRSRLDVLIKLNTSGNKGAGGYVSM
jgi:hypothetical protein